MRISVFGLGYVGSVTAACLAKRGHFIVGVDVNPFKVECIERGTAPFMETGLTDLIQEARKKKSLEATTDAGVAVSKTDVSMICVPTPSRPNGDLDLRYMERVSRQIGEAISKKSDDHLVVVRSTVLPGTTDRLIIPLLEETSSKKVFDSIGVCYNPEFLREGSAIQDFFHPPKTVVGESRGKDGDILQQIYEDLPGPLLRTEIQVAEMVKYTDNSFHALKTTFANEIGRVCKAHGIDSHAVMDIFCRDTKLNISRAYLKPGFAFGGSCLPKDLRALVYRAKRKDVEVPLLATILDSNRQQIEIAVRKIQASEKTRVGVLGLSFKAETDDLRESPLVELVETLLGKGYQVRIHDRNVTLSHLHGTNRDYVNKHIPHLSVLLSDCVDDVLEASEVIILGSLSDEYRDIPMRLRKDQICLDLVRITDQPETKGLYEGISW